VDNVKEIVDAVKARGLDGIAITEHYDKAYGYRVKEVVDRYFNAEILIIPGQEIIGRGSMHIVELDLPYDIIFRFIAHVGYPYIKDLSRYIDDSIHGMELRNPEMDPPSIREVAEEYGLLLLTNSDAHLLSDIGKYYNEIDIKGLCARAQVRRNF